MVDAGEFPDAKKDALIDVDDPAVLARRWSMIAGHILTNPIAFIDRIKSIPDPALLKDLARVAMSLETILTPPLEPLADQSQKLGAARSMKSVFGDLSSLDLTRGDAPLIVETLAHLINSDKFSNRYQDVILARLMGMNGSDAASEYGLKNAHVVSLIFQRSTTSIRKRYTQEDAFAILQQRLQGAPFPEPVVLASPERSVVSPFLKKIFGDVSDLQLSYDDMELVVEVILHLHGSRRSDSNMQPILLDELRGVNRDTIAAQYNYAGGATIYQKIYNFSSRIAEHYTQEEASAVLRARLQGTPLPKPVVEQQNEDRSKHEAVPEPVGEGDEKLGISRFLNKVFGDVSDLQLTGKDAVLVQGTLLHLYGINRLSARTKEVILARLEGHSPEQVVREFDFSSVQQVHQLLYNFSKVITAQYSQEAATMMLRNVVQGTVLPESFIKAESASKSQSTKPKARQPRTANPKKPRAVPTYVPPKNPELFEDFRGIRRLDLAMEQEPQEVLGRDAVVEIFSRILNFDDHKSAALRELLESDTSLKRVVLRSEVDIVVGELRNFIQENFQKLRNNTSLNLNQAQLVALCKILGWREETDKPVAFENPIYLRDYARNGSNEHDYDKEMDASDAFDHLALASQKLANTDSA